MAGIVRFKLRLQARGSDRCLRAQRCRNSRQAKTELWQELQASFGGAASSAAPLSRPFLLRHRLRATGLVLVASALLSKSGKIRHLLRDTDSFVGGQLPYQT
jgi:hypothetical protein